MALEKVLKDVDNVTETWYDSRQANRRLRRRNETHWYFI